jgi:MADS-box transcription factor
MDPQAMAYQGYVQRGAPPPYGMPPQSGMPQHSADLLPCADTPNIMH